MVISEIELNNSKILKISLDNVNGRIFGQLRIWVRTNTYDIIIPSVKGFGFDLKHLNDIIRALITLKAMNHTTEYKA